MTQNLESPKMFRTEYQAGYQKVKFCQFSYKIPGNQLPVKHPIEKPILSNFMNLSAIFFPRL